MQVLSTIGKAWGLLKATLPFVMWAWIGWAVQLWVPNPLPDLLTTVEWKELAMMLAPTASMLVIWLAISKVLETPANVLYRLAAVSQGVVLWIAWNGGMKILGLTGKPGAHYWVATIVGMASILLVFWVLDATIYRARRAVRKYINLILYSTPYVFSDDPTQGRARFAHRLDALHEFNGNMVPLGIAVQPPDSFFGVGKGFRDKLARAVARRVIFYSRAARILLFGVPSPDRTSFVEELADRLKALFDRNSKKEGRHD